MAAVTYFMTMYQIDFESLVMILGLAYAVFRTISLIDSAKIAKIVSKPGCPIKYPVDN